MAELRERANAGLHDFVFDYIKREIAPKVGSPVLDIGCGSGAWLQRFQVQGFTNMMGIDLDTEQFSLEHVITRAMNLDDYYAVC